MTRSAPRLSQRLLDVIDDESKRAAPIAEVCRRVGEQAERLGLSRPSYEQVRVLVHQYRRLRRLRPTTAEVVADVVVRARAPHALVEHLHGDAAPRRRP